MKTLTIACLAVALLTAPLAQAHDNHWFTGAVIGTATGLIIANNVHGLDPWVAGSAGALIGGAMANNSHHGYYGHGYGYSPYYNHGGYYRPYGWDRAYYGPTWSYPRYQTRVITVKAPAAQAPRTLAPPVDLQPGVELIKVSIQNSNGIRTDVPILRTKGHFVGPQGETYETLPDTATLTRRYGM